MEDIPERFCNINQHFDKAPHYLIWEKYKDELGEDPDFYRFWSDKSLQLDGEFTLNQLKVFVKMMEEMQAVK